MSNKYRLNKDPLVVGRSATCKIIERSIKDLEALGYRVDAEKLRNIYRELCG